MTALDTDSLRACLDGVLPLARSAGAILMEGFRHAPTVRLKSRSDLVTEFDERSEAWLRAGLAERHPDHSFVGEEGGGQPGELAWYVDPIDGTTNFAHGHPFFCLSMGLCRGDEPLVGIVLAPALGLEWTAVRGGGTFRNGARCQVSGCSSIEDALLASGFPATRASQPDNNYGTFLALDAATHGVRRCGAAALEIAMVSDGAYDGFWDIGLKPWDVAAGALLVREAGGVVSDFDGGPLGLRSGRFLATNGRVHAAVQRGVAGGFPRPPLGGIGRTGLPTQGEVG